MAKSIYQVLVEIEGNEKAQKALTDIGKAAGLTGAALTAFSGAAAKAAASYETSLAKVATLATDATGSTQEFDEAINQLSQEMNGAISINEAAAASYDILSAGYSDQADVLAILGESQKTAIGGFSDLATISDASTTVMNAFGDALGENLSVTEKMKLVTDGMIATQNLGKITAGQYAAQIGNVASTAAAAGVSLEEVNAVVATATAQGVRVESTFAGLNQVLAAIMKPTSEATTKAAELGIEFDAAALKSMGLQGVLKQLVDSGQATAENMTMLFGSVEAVKVLMPLVSNDAAKFNSNLEAMADTAGTVDEAFETMSETTEQKALRAFNKLQNAFIRLGQGVMVAVEPLIDILNGLLDVFGALPKPIQQFAGLLVLVSGGALTLAGAVAMATVAYTSFKTTMAAFLPIATAQVPALAGMSLSMKGLTVSAGAATISLKALAVAAGYLTVIIGGLLVVYDTLSEKGKEIDAISMDLRKGMKEVNEEILGQTNALNENTDAQNRNIEAKRKWYDYLGGQRKKRLIDYQINVRDLRGEIGQYSEKILSLGDSEAEAAAKQKLFTDGIAALDKAMSELDEEKLGTKVYEELRNELIVSKKELTMVAKAKGVVTSATNENNDAATDLIATLEKQTDATKELTKEEENALEAEKKAIEEKQKAIASIEDKIETRNEESALERKRKAELDAVTDSIESQTKALEANRDAAIDRIKETREEGKIAQEIQFEDEIEARKTEAADQRLEMEREHTDQIEWIKNKNEADRINEDRQHTEEVELLKEREQESRNLADRNHAEEIERLKDQRSESRRKAEEALANQIAARQDAQSETFTEAKKQAAAWERLLSAETAEERDKIERELAQQRRMEERAAALDLANQVLSASQALNLAKRISGVGDEVSTPEEAQRVQAALAEIERQQKEQQSAADKAAMEALKEAERQKDLALEAEIREKKQAYEEQKRAETLAFEDAIEERKRAYEDKKRAEAIAFEDAIEARKRLFEDQQRKLDRDLEAELEAKEAAFKAQQRELDKQAALEIEAIRSGAETQIEGIRDAGEARTEAINERFDNQAFVEEIRRQGEQGELSLEEIKRLTSLAQQGNQAQQVTGEKQNQSIQALTSQAQVHTQATQNTLPLLQSQAGELQRLNATNASILNRVTNIQGQLSNLPSAIAASLPRPQPIATASR